MGCFACTFFLLRNVGNALIKNDAKLVGTLCSRSYSTVYTYLYIDVSGASLMHVEVDNLWTEASLHLDIHLVAGLHQLFG